MSRLNRRRRARLRRRGGRGILRQAAFIFCSHPITFLVISFLLCSLRFTIEQLFHPIFDQRDFYGRFNPSFNGMKHIFSRNTTNLTPTSSFLRIPLSHDFPEIPDLNIIYDDNSHVDIDLREIEIRRLFEREDYIVGLRLALASYSWVLCASELVYAFFRGIVFVQVINHVNRNQRSLIHTIRTGFRIGFVRLIFWISWINFRLRNDALRRIMNNSKEIGNLYILLAIVSRWLFIPFVNRAPWVLVTEWGTIPFTMITLSVDLILGLLCSVGSSVLLVDWFMMTFFGMLKETFHLLVVSLTSAVGIRVMEAIICGAIGRGMLWSIFGNLGSLAVQCVMEVFFLVVWVLYYLSARKLLGRQQLDYYQL